MVHRRPLTLLLLVATSAWCGAQQPAPPRPTQPDVREAEPPLPEIRVAEDGPPLTDADQRTLDRLATLLQLLQQERGRGFQRPVVVGFYDRSQIRGWAERRLYEELPPDYLEASGRAYVALGLLPPGTDLAAMMAEVLTIGVGGFFDPERDRLYALTSELGALNQYVMIHECMHALQDHRTSLAEFVLSNDLLEDEEHAIGRAAVVEGEATYLTNRIVGRHAEQVFEAGDFDVRGLADLFVQQVAMGGAAPPVIVDGMTFAYTQGEAFIAAVHDHGGWPAVDALYETPPVSSEQVIHPEKYLPGRAHDEPVTVRAPDLLPLLGEGWSHVYRNRLGELGTRQLVQFSGDPGDVFRASWGWDGDEYRLYGHAGAGDLLQWLSTWDSEQDAAEMVDALAGVITRQGAGRAGWRLEREADSAGLLFVDAQGVVRERVARQGAWVVWLRGLPPGLDVEALARRCLP